MRGEYVFAHPLIQRRLYQSLLPGRRRKLHRQVARAATSGTGTTNGELAHHYALGFGRRAERKAVQYCWQAAEQAEVVLAYESAARFWELALDCTRAGSLQSRAELQWRLGWALWAANNWTRAAEVWSEAAQHFQSLGESARVAQIALALGEIFRFRLDRPAAVHWLERALALLPEPVSQERARALALLGSIRCIDGGAGDGLGLLQQACDALPGGHADPMVGYWLAFGFLVSGEESRGHEVAVQAFEEARRTNSSRAITLLAGGLIHNELTHLRPDMAEYYSRILEAAVDATDVAALSQSLLSRALVLGYSGRWQEVLELCEQWMGRVRLAGKFQVATARLIWAEAARALGHPDAAVTEMRRALADLDEMRPLAPLHLARALATAGDPVEATEIAHVSATVVLEGRRFATARVLLGELASRLDEPELWERCLESLSGERRPLVMGYSPISVRRVRGRLAMRLKRWALATACFEETAQELGQGAAWWELAQTYLDYAEMRRLRRRRGDETKAAALELEAARLLTALGIDTLSSRAGTPGQANGNRFGLTGRELEVLALLSEGRRNQEIADALTLSRRTVERHLENIFAKMAVKSRAEAIVAAVEEGLIVPRPERRTSRLPANAGTHE
jgi:DNA-binding CsgD family transcriptional regulator